MHTQTPARGTRLRVGDYLIDPARGLICGEAGETHVEPKIMDVLCFLARKQGEVVSRDELINAVWRVKFGADYSLSRAISFLRKAFRSNNYIETIPKRGYRLIVPVTPVDSEGVPASHNEVLDAEKRTFPPPTPELRRWRPLVVSLSILAIVMTAAVTWWWYDGRSTPDVIPNGIVEVRAFDVLVNDPEAKRLKTGLENNLRQALSAAGVETVAESPDVRGGAAPSEAELLINGSIDRDGDEYLVTVHVDHRRDHLTLWSTRFRRNVEERIALQSQIAGRMAGALRCGLAARAPHPKAMTTHVFGMFLEACSYFGYASLESSTGLYRVAQRIVAVAPNLAISHGLFAAANSVMADSVRMPQSEKQAYRDAARKAAARTLEIDPDNGTAYWALAAISPPDPRHWAATESYLHKVRSVDLNYPYALMGLAWVARSAGRIGEATELERRAAALAPFHPYITGVLAYLLAMNGALPEADALLARAETLWPNAKPVASYRLQIAMWYRSPDVAEKLLQRYTALLGITDSEMACDMAFLNARRNLSTARLKAVRTSCQSVVSKQGTFGLTYVVHMLATLGDMDGAYRLVEDNDFGKSGTIFLFYPEMHAFRRDPRFMPLAQRIGLVDYWRKTNRWPDFCKEPDLPYYCKRAAVALEKKLDTTHATAGKKKDAPSPVHVKREL